MRVSTMRDRLADARRLAGPRAVGWMVAALALVACGAGDGGGGNGGAGGGNGGGGQGGAGGAMLMPRGCGDGAPCGANATCSRPLDIEWVVQCTCDPSGHFECFIGGGGGPPNTCYPGQLCTPPAPEDPPTCTKNNGFCERTCACDASGQWADCMHDCQGSGPAADDTLCDLSLCDSIQDMIQTACTVNDGACSYSVKCGPDGASYEGSCAAP